MREKKKNLTNFFFMFRLFILFRLLFFFARYITLNEETENASQWARACEYALGGANVLENTFLVTNKEDIGPMNRLINSCCSNAYEAGQYRVVYVKMLCL